MKRYGEKLKLIFVPYILCSFACLAVYTFLHWLIFIRYSFFVVDDEILMFWVPFAIPWIPILIWLRPRIKLLDLKNKSGKGDPLTGFMVFAWMTMAAPLIISQAYLVSASGKLTSLNSISEVIKKPATKYYSVRHYYADKALAGYKAQFKVSGKYNSDFDMYIYIVVPVYDTNHIKKTYNYRISSPNSTINSDNALIILNGKIANKADLTGINPKSISEIKVLKGATAAALYGEAARFGVIVVQTKPYQGRDTLQSVFDDDMHFTPVVWLGVKYQKTIRNRLSTAEKNERYQQFAKESEADFNAKRLDNFAYLDRVPYNDDLKAYTKAIESDRYYPSLAGAKIVLLPVNESFEARSGHELIWIFISIGIGSVVMMVLLLFKPLKNDAEVSPQDDAGDSSWLNDLKLFFMPRRGFFITTVIIDANIVIFIAMACAGLGFMTFEGHDLLKWGANYRPAIDKGEYWRLFTSIFLHGGAMHLLFNMYGLLFVGLFLEPVMGRAKYLLAYLLTGLSASIASAWWHAATVSIGASGAIFGLYGVFFALLTVNVFPKNSKKSFLISTSIFIGYNLLNGLTGGVDNAAHIGGLLSGLLLGYILYPSLKNDTDQKRAEAESKELLDEFS